ncbi:hypothetical protein A2W24_03040 [Microgenomates group bacterium RBG_16_45_19]|nr:MAG: hypothetical protein A2W24_03040 [Microgenomates group bacterium RBG_16_45_19]
MNKPKLDHLYRMTDMVGIAEHCLIATPDLREGYCVDDNARALQVALRLKEEKLVDIYLKFLVSAAGKYSYKNDLNQNLVWENESIGENFGRAMAGLADTIKLGLRDDQKLTGMFLFDQYVKYIEKVESLRSKAWLIYGLLVRDQCSSKLGSVLENYIKVKISKKKIGQMSKYDFKKMAIILSDELITSYEKNSDISWRWFEDKITYDIGRLPWALFWAYSVFGNIKYLNIAKESLDLLLEQIYDKKLDCFSFPGYRGWFEKNGKKALFVQQPIEAGSVVEACTEAFSVTKEKKYLDWAQKALDWYHGRNILGARMVDQNTGGVYDGLEEKGINLNQGAESLLSYLLARLSVQFMPRKARQSVGVSFNKGSSFVQ